jgi:hypothetical protein
VATTSNYGWTTPDDSDAVALGAAAIRSLGSAVDARVFQNSQTFEVAQAAFGTAGGTATGALNAPDFQLGVTAAGSNTVALDFSTGNGFITRAVDGTAVSVTATGYEPGAIRTVRFTGGTAVASLSFPVGWVFVGSAAGTALGTATTAILSATSFGTAAADVVAVWAVKP